MANYECASRTNYFRVTDEEKYQELFGKFTDNIVQDFSKEIDGIIYHGFGAYDSVEYCLECDFNVFIKELRKILPEDEAFILFESGNEKLRYVTGVAYVCTRHNEKCFDLNTLAVQHAKNILGDDFQTETCY